ncbi:hypothetical protein KOI35_28420 [Actinoplanes bogorensis]|uniref:histidine kinase n=1 Tax=Paractinoplanes bogorensis TaxID=1610840 RepID=A0ABS5YXI8_9ACTN|nr:hypothetical protein [Actinoplanes bogorensis]MBU2667443.1 hypothetical protein [Actinoplanes bogorensis]
MRLRTQLTVIVTALVALVVALAGLVIVLRIDHRDRDDLDRVLAARAEQVRTAATKNGSLPTDGSFAIRLIQDGEMLKQVGSSAGFPMPAKDGYSTVSSGDDDWRSYAETLPTGAQMQILVSLDALKEQHTDNVLIVDLLVLLAAVLSAAGVWFATGLVMRPFQRLLTAARDLDPADPDQSLPEVKSPREVAELTDTLNGLLARARGVPAATAVAAPTVEMRAVDRKPAVSDEPVGDADAAAAAHEGELAAREAELAVQKAELAAREAELTAREAELAAEPARPAEPAPQVAPEPVPAVALPSAELRPSLADLGFQLDQLMDNPEMPATQRHLILALMADEHRRMTALLNGDA